MLLSAQEPITTVYPVEVSGWDSRQSFFVELSELEWGEETSKCITLSHSLSCGAMIFLRLLQPTSGDRSAPVAYQAEQIGEMSKGRWQFLLKPIQRRNESTSLMF